MATLLYVQRIESRYISEEVLAQFLERMFSGNYWYELTLDDQWKVGVPVPLSQVRSRVPAC
ncbi:hypothetical protein Q9L58_010101 [Maublancomyces gigas]|uniref:Uncharacterized protein n=1 Tax=Discina gigas TaxID=1032678 RepID=A0ABR3G5J3_9PEZI